MNVTIMSTLRPQDRPNGYYEEFPLNSSSSTLPVQSSKKFLLKNNDIIFENDLIQIGIKGESTKNSMHIELYYGNKTSFNLTNFSSTIFASGELESGKISILTTVADPENQ
jgi:hypothetical protein